tara:strand:- start:6934 stop:8244 length:1311 start_codon:yes stop_codon:yes gene_type:complete
LDDYNQWLEAIGQMVPNTQSAIIAFTSDHESKAEKKACWPNNDFVSDELNSLVAFSISQQSSSTSAVSGSNYRTVLPIMSSDNEVVCYLGIEVNLGNGSQESVKRIVEWSGVWLGLLLQQDSEKKRLHNSTPATVNDLDNSLAVSSLQANAPLIDSAESSVSSFKNHLLYRYKYLFVFFVITLFLFIPVEYRISVDAVIEGEIESPIIAPFDGYIKSSKFKAGDQVDISTVIAELDERDISLKLNKLKGQFQEKENSYRQVLASGERGKAEVLKAKMAQLSAQIETVTLALSQTELRSRISGVLISGDLSRSIGAPVNKGDVLFKIAPLDQYRTMLRIKEADIRFMQQGLSAQLKLTSLPSDTYTVELQKPSPVFTDENNEVIYLAEAVMEEGNYSALRPGMEGIAKVNVGSYSLGWSLFHHFSDWVRMQYWALKP